MQESTPSAELLIVSQDASLVSGLQAECAAQGISLRVRNQIDELLEIIKSKPPSLLILDPDLRDEPAWDVLAEIKLDPQIAKIIFLIVSGRFTNPRHVVEGLRRGAVEYLLKPCDPRVVVLRGSGLDIRHWPDGELFRRSVV